MIFLLAAALTFEDLQSLAKPCASCNDHTTHDSTQGPLVFMSFSVPTATWLDYSQQLEPLDGTFILRGLPDGSFDTLVAKVHELRQAGVNAAIEIDPPLFATYHIETVPAIVLRDGPRHDSLIGNLRLDAALTRFAESGDTGEKASQLLTIFREQP